MFSACSKKMQGIESPHIIAPMHLVQEEKIPDFEGNTNGEFLEFTRNLQSIIEKQNINLKAIRIWLETL